MPHSLVLNLQPRSPIPASHLSGRHLHALFLDLVRSQNSTLSETLHKQVSEKSFTLSALQTRMHPSRLQYQHQSAIAEPCWWRISLLDDSLFSQLAHLWLNLNPKQSWQLGAAELTVTSILGTAQLKQPWAGFSSYAQLYEQASECDRQIKLQFCTPTTFRQTQYDSALPTKELVFQSLLRRWNQYSGIAFSEAIVEPIFPSYFDIRTEIVMDSRSKLIGCVGEVTFTILGEVEAETIRQINTLANFAMYAGVGRKTPMGMGMVRRK
ncbi:CRISPR-associated endoribonuclease Cas6 [Leptolyngbya sp. NIES-2104]|uniref:CRISPR-associated endoribonuclease Cas6 n=1 Tax=Leptolyngbya sp. NIES-2104 TaxID=1552121 RepID=UPI0006ECA84D|nr:CRISPR-associated endoribonuclease Cas6 [Leptolyngbya sp. NIES-2104]GAP94324.1 CRISPR repeat RNA endoribonuclease Cas6 [Leptolyngbya sp. NIES-2104]